MLPTVVVIVFLLTVALGVALAVMSMRFQRSSSVLALLHAGAALMGFILLLTQLQQASSLQYNLSALLFGFALLGGLVLLALRISRREYRTPAPSFAILLHAVMGVAALLLLLVAYRNA
jgi:peptidoglycan/LPS O-acetylase OafA/YrhL